MDRASIKEIASQWMIPTPGVAYMSGLEDRPVIASAKGSIVVDTESKEYLDFGSGQMAAAMGHNHPRMVANVQQSLKTMLHSTNTMLNVKSLELHKRLGELLTKPLQKSLFLVSGSDSVEACIDLARKYTGGIDVLGLHAGLHGSTSFLTRSLSFGWNRSKHPVVAQATSSILAPYCYRCPLGLKPSSCKFQCLKTSMELADANFTGKPAAAIAEPILSAGGVIVPPEGYFPALKEECAKRDMLLIFDEAQTGLGKTGKLFGHNHVGVAPDIMALSKHFGGEVPISAVCTTAEIADKAAEKGYFATRSHATDPLLCSAGTESLNIVVEEDMAGKAAAIETNMKGAFNEMAKEFEVIGDIRGRGVLFGVELVEDRETRVPANDLADKINRHALEAGLMIQTRGSGGRKNVLRFVPPMTTPHELIDRAMSIVHDGLRKYAH